MFKIQNYVDPEFFVRFYKTNFDIEVRTHWRLKIDKKRFLKMLPHIVNKQRSQNFILAWLKKRGSTCA